MPITYKLEDFKPAQPVNTYVKMAFAGPQNSGKTVSALRVAAGLGGETCVIDSENKRALKYANSFKFRHFDLQPPFSSENYGAAVDAAIKAGFNNIVIDSMSHEHEGPGGMLEQVQIFLDRKTRDIEDEKARDKKKEALKMSAFIEPKMARNRFIQFSIQRVNANVLLCFRAKNKMEMKKEKWENGDRSGVKTVVADAGLQPIGGEEFWYEMDIVSMLREGSNGKPAWDEQACRINEFPRGRLTEFLHSVQQYDENVGRRLREFNTPVAAASAETIAAGNAASEKGVAALTAWKDSLTLDVKETIRPHWTSWQSTAKVADSVKAAS